jgi:hypothetical protein
VTKHDGLMILLGGALAAVAVGLLGGRVGLRGGGPARTPNGDATAVDQAGVVAGGRGPAGAAGGEAGSAADLGRTVARLQERIAAVEQNRTKLQAELARVQDLLARSADGGRARRSDFDLTPDDWATLARDGTVKYRLPCERERNWVPGAEDLPEMGLTPEEAPLLTDAYRRSYQRSWADVKALCTEALGSAEVAEKLGRNTCTHLILDLARRSDAGAVDEAMRQVGEIRAGQRAAPAVEDQSAAMRLMLVLTGELKRFEDDLGRDLGPEAAHQLAYSSHLCSNQSVFGGPGPRRAQPSSGPGPDQ